MMLLLISIRIRVMIFFKNELPHVPVTEAFIRKLQIPLLAMLREMNALDITVTNL